MCGVPVTSTRFGCCASGAVALSRGSQWAGNSTPTTGVRVRKHHALPGALIAGGYEHRIAAPIIKKDNEAKSYDLWARFKLQVSLYPFVDRKDLIDAVSRIYDMSPRGPEFIDSTILEPEVT